MKKKIIKFVVDKAKKNKLVQSVFLQSIDLSKFPIKETFTDSNGNKHYLYQGLRSKLRPGWENVFKQKTKETNKSEQTIDAIIERSKRSIDAIESTINVFVSGVKDKRILEVGCNSGGASYILAKKGAKEVIGTEFSGYKIESLDHQDYKANDLAEVNNDLKLLRELVANRFEDAEKVSFVDDDICKSTISDKNFDIICSWDVLEHLHDPLSALRSMKNLLSDDGILIHEYNPFFSLAGGHSACTIDIPWGHVVLDSKDFEKFNENHQPQRKDICMSFYTNGLNRMTFNDFDKYCEEAGLEILSQINFPKEQDLKLLDKLTMDRAKSNYPTLNLNDLITYKSLVVLRKKQ